MCTLIFLILYREWEIKTYYVGMLQLFRYLSVRVELEICRRWAKTVFLVWLFSVSETATTVHPLARKKSCFWKHGFGMCWKQWVKTYPLLNQTSLLLHQTVFQTSSNRNIYILQVRMGRHPPYARVYCAVWSTSKPNGTLSHGLASMPTRS